MASPKEIRNFTGCYKSALQAICGRRNWLWLKPLALSVLTACASHSNKNETVQPTISETFECLGVWAWFSVVSGNYAAWKNPLEREWETILSTLYPGESSNSSSNQMSYRDGMRSVGGGEGSVEEKDVLSVIDKCENLRAAAHARMGVEPK